MGASGSGIRWAGLAALGLLAACTGAHAQGEAESPSRAGVTVRLDSLTERADRYVATFTFSNTNDVDVGVALMLDGEPYRAKLSLTDALGGVCQVAANGEGWGDLPAVYEDGRTLPLAMRHFTVVAAKGQARHVVFFNKGRCAEPPTATEGLMISGEMAAFKDGAVQRVPLSFADLALQGR